MPPAGQETGEAVAVPTGVAVPTPAADRMAWADIAKAGAIVLVVAYHAGRTGLPLIAPELAGQGSRLWLELNKVLLPVRMPVFFLVSGVLAARAITRPWSRLWQPRILSLLWPFALWTVIFGFVWVSAVFPDDPSPWLSYNLRVLPFGGLAYWYLWTLVVFFVVARVFRRFPAQLLLASVALLALTPSISAWAGAGGTHSLTVNVTRLTTFALWFFLGCFGADLVKRLAPRLGVGAVAASVSAYVVLAYAQYYAEPGLDVVFALSITGVAAALSISVVAARFGPVRRLAAYLARRTLAIYVLHPVMINGLVILSRYRDVDLSSMPGAAVAGFLFVPVLTVVCTVAAVLAYDAAKRVGVPWVFGWPEPGLRERLRRWRRSAGPDTEPAPLSTRH